MEKTAQVLKLAGFVGVLSWFAGACLKDGKVSGAEFLLGAGLAWVALCLAATNNDKRG